jgi:predicted CoA-binding protein
LTPQTHLDRIREILTAAKTIADVGYSQNPGRPSHWIAVYLQRHGYRVIPVNPGLDEGLGEKCYPTLLDVPEAVDIVNIYRSPPAVPEVVDHAIAKGAKVVWMQEGAENPDAAAKAEAAGLVAVVGRCIYRDHMALVAGA